MDIAKLEWKNDSTNGNTSLIKMFAEYLNTDLFLR